MCGCWSPADCSGAAECVARTGLVRQARYAITHVALLWFFNTMWPDVNQPELKGTMRVAQSLHNTLVLPAALVAVVQAFRRRHARLMLVALHVLALVAVAILYFGDTRLRAPYDGFLIILAATTYASAVGFVRGRLGARRTEPAGDVVSRAR